MILHLNYVHCDIKDTIGYDGFVLFHDELKKNYTNVSKLSMQESYSRWFFWSNIWWSAIIDILNEIGLDVAILGNHEFYFGVEQLLELKTSIIKSQHNPLKL